MAYPYDLVSTDAQTALTEFDAAFMMYFQGAVSPWAEDSGLGKVHTSNMLKTTWPVPIHNAGYSRLTGDPKFRSLAEKSFDLLQDTYQDGVEELARVIEAPDFIAWDDQPMAMALEARRLPNKLVAALLESNSGAGPACWTGVSFFNAAHPVCPIGGGSTATFKNLTTSRPLTVENFATSKVEMSKIKGINGENLGLQVTHLMVPNDLSETAKDILNNPIVLDSTGTAGVTNRHASVPTTLIVAPELTETKDWYVIASGPGVYLWVVLKKGTSPDNRILDKTSDMYKKTGRVAVNSVWDCNAGLALPQRIHKYRG